MSFWPALQHSLNPSVTLLNWVKVYNAVCTPTPIHRLCTQTFSPPQKTNALLGIEPAAPLPSQRPSRDVNPLHQSTTPYYTNPPTTPIHYTNPLHQSTTPSIHYTNPPPHTHIHQSTTPLHSYIVRLRTYRPPLLYHVQVHSNAIGA